jgi:branched-subunit amino acid transport protein
MLGLVVYFQRILVLARVSRVEALLSVTQDVMQFAAVVLLFTGEATRWFKRARPRS